jgi:hypothetical protein
MRLDQIHAFLVGLGVDHEELSPLDLLAVISEEKAAQLTGLSKDTWRRQCMRGEGAVRIPLSRRRYGYRLIEVLEFIERQAALGKANKRGGDG